MKVFALLVLVLSVIACSGGANSTTTASTPTPTTSTIVPADGAPVESAGTNPISVYAPDDLGPYPVIVTVHGGGWVGGDPADMAALAESLGNAAVVFNVTYRTMSRGGRFPGMVTDVACDVVAATEQAAAYTTTPGGVYLVAHSAGAHLAALVALAPGVFTCGDQVPDIDGFVGLAGPYDVTRLAILNTFFGATLEEAPDVWARGNPVTYAGSAPDIRVLLIHGTDDDVVPLSFSTDLAAALEAAGADIQLLELPDVDHRGVHDPLVVGDLITDFVIG